VLAHARPSRGEERHDEDGKPLHQGTPAGADQRWQRLLPQTPPVGHRGQAAGDGAPIHQGDVRTFLSAGGAGQVPLAPLPGYAPELNPTEGVWQHLKHGELRNGCCADLGQLRRELHLAIRRLGAKPDLIKAFFAGAQLNIGA
jgi:hypothetical protein